MEKENHKKKLIVVLGMHRSGTSALTRGLQALDVELGESLFGAIPENNAKGFWEDIEINTLNNDILIFLGHNWHSTSSISEPDFYNESLAPFKARAIELLCTKMESANTFGIKDPRIARLLPFWKPIFEKLDIDVSYVIALRNPLSVASSLHKRDGFELEKSSYLWLGHMVPSLLDSEGRPRIVVDYDRLMAHPKDQLRRIASALNLPFSEESSATKEYCCDFLADELRHATFHYNDLKTVSGIPRDLVSAYNFLEKFSADELPVNTPEVRDEFLKINQRMIELQPAFTCLDKYSNTISALNQITSERDTQITSLTQQLEEKQHQFITVNQQLQEERQQVISLSQKLEEMQYKISSLDRHLQEKQFQLDTQSRKLQEKQDQVDAMLSSSSWKFTAPFREAAKIIRQAK